MSYLALLNYSFKDKYILDLSFTKEGSSLFATDFRWGDFFSVASAWNIAKENFLADSEIISNLKLRVSYHAVPCDRSGHGGARFGGLVRSWRPVWSRQQSHPGKPYAGDAPAACHADSE
jgi:hypothetical protein